SARGMERSKIEALDAGADDYVTKPFGIGELTARIRVALRHSARGGKPGQTETDPVFRVGSLEVDQDKRIVSIDGRKVHLTPIEYKLLQSLVRHAGKVITHRMLLQEVWGSAFTEQTQYLRVYMRQLRNKIEEDPTRPRYLRTEPGVGYRLADE